MNFEDQNDASLIDRAMRRNAHPGGPAAVDAELPPYNTSPEGAEPFAAAPGRPRSRVWTRVRRGRWDRARVITALGRGWIALLGLALVACAGVFLGLTVLSQTRWQRTPDVKYAPPAARPAPRTSGVAPSDPATGAPAAGSPAAGFSDSDGDGIDDGYGSYSGGMGAPPSFTPIMPSTSNFSAGARNRQPAVPALPQQSDWGALGGSEPSSPQGRKPKSRAAEAPGAEAPDAEAPDAEVSGVDAPARSANSGGDAQDNRQPAPAGQVGRPLAPAGAPEASTFSTDTRRVASKTFRRRGDGTWVDTAFREEDKLPLITVIAGSPESKRLLEEHKGLLPFFRLADQLIVVFEGTVYRVVPQE